MPLSGDIQSLLEPRRGGRPKGSPNHATRELKEDRQMWFASEDYQASAKRRILAGDAQQIEMYLLQMCYGKPREHIELTVAAEEDLTGMSVEQLEERATSLVQQLKEAQAVEDAIPGEVVIKPPTPTQDDPQAVTIRNAIIIERAAALAASRNAESPSVVEKPLDNSGISEQSSHEA